jgi:hypothetical protein
MTTSSYRVQMYLGCTPYWGRLIGRGRTCKFPASSQMVETFELHDMSDRPQEPAPSTSTISINPDDADGTITAWSLATFTLSVPSPWSPRGWQLIVPCVRLLVLAGLFVVSPRLLIFMAGESRTLLTTLEAFLTFQFGILLFAVSLGVLVNVRRPIGISQVRA